MRSRKKGKLQLKFLMGLIAMTVVLMITLCFVITTAVPQQHGIILHQDGL